MIVSDITIEKLSEVLEDNPRVILVARDELSSWLYSFPPAGTRAGQGGSDVPNWLELHHAGPLMPATAKPASGGRSSCPRPPLR